MLEPPDLNPDPRRLRAFGWASSVILLALAAQTVSFGTCLLLHVPEGLVPGLSLGLALAAAPFLLLTLWRPPFLRPLWVVFTLAAWPIGTAFSLLLLCALFYLLVTPLGILRRILTGDPLRRRFDPKATTYWCPRGPPPPVERYFRQF